MGPGKRSGGMRALVLNVDDRPLHITSAGKALVHVLMGKAESILDSDTIAHSADLELAFPRIIRLNAYINAPRSTRSVPIQNRTVLARDRHRCAYCNGKASEVEHVIPRGQGGQHVWENVVSACHACNHRKGNRDPEQAKMPLLYQPRRPSGASARMLLGMVDEAWEPYLLKEAA